MKIDIRHNFPDVKRQIDRLHADVTSKALPRALNRTVEQAKTAISREIRREFVMDQATVNEALRITRAHYRSGVLHLTATLEAKDRKGRSLNLIRFVEKSVTMAAARKRMAAGEGGSYNLRGREVQKQLELRFKIKRGSPAKTIKGAFIANQGRTVFIRKGKARLPIEALQVIGVAQMFNTRRIKDKVVATTIAKFPEVFQREAAYYLDRFNRGGL